MTMEICPVCNDRESQLVLLEISDIPVFCNVLHPDEASGRNAAKGDIDLMFCQLCGHVYNRSFDASKTEYSESYENSLHYSPRFQEYADKLANGLVDKYNLRGKTVVDIGCGKGDFLRMLSRLGGNRCIGFDPSYEEDREAPSERNEIEVIRDYFSPQYADIEADMVICRHVLEHIETPGDFLQSIRQVVGERSNTAILFEVPNVMYTLKDLGIWDLIYEHCGYFSTASLLRLFREASFFPVDVQSVFGGQYLTIEALPVQSTTTLPSSHDDGLKEITKHAKAFAQAYREKFNRWQNRMKEFQTTGQKAVVWGAGSKGITFVNMMKDHSAIECLVDINPHKQGMYGPGTGLRVVGIDALHEIKPSTVIVMNPLYVEEIRTMLAEQEIECEIVSE